MEINGYTKTALSIQKVFNFYDLLSCGVHREFKSSFYYPVFIIGAPRSGSTLIYQLLLKHGRFAYISNLMSLLPGFMIILAKIFKNFHEIENISSSQYGYIPGFFSPSEAGAIFQKWFETEPSEVLKKRIRNTYSLISDYLNAPLLSKNLKNSLRLQNIYTTFPEARFIYVKRDPLFNAQSILLARRKLMGSDYEWWSVAPENHKSVLGKNPMYQVIWQVLEINKHISDFIKKFSPEYIEISY